jgi:transcription termination factor NusB
VSELGRNVTTRERALEIFYESAIKERPVAVIVTELNTRPDEYTLDVLDVERSPIKSRANELISEFSIDWPLERIALVDRLIMTLAVGEMLMENATAARGYSGRGR